MVLLLSLSQVKQIEPVSRTTASPTANPWFAIVNTNTPVAGL